MSNQREPEILISGDGLQKVGWILFGLAIVFTLIGALVSPLDDDGKPVLLLPEVKAMEDYRKSAMNWLVEINVLDGEIARVAAEPQGDLFSQSRVAHQALQHAAQLAQQVDRTRVPPMGIGLHEQMLSTTLGYLEAARSTLQWVSAPGEEIHAQAIRQLENARVLKSNAETNQWLTR